MRILSVKSKEEDRRKEGEHMHPPGVLGAKEVSNALFFRFTSSTLVCFVHPPLIELWKID